MIFLSGNTLAASQRTSHFDKIAMPVLSDLPNEVFDLILQQTHPGDLEAFLQISKTLRQNLEWLLREHYKLKRNYSTFTYHNNTPRGAPARILKTILNQPRIAEYVLKMDVEGWETEFEESTSPLEYTIEDSEMFSKAVKASKYVFPWTLEWLLCRMQNGDEEHILILLLTLLPNLEHVRLVNEFHIDLGLTMDLMSCDDPIQCLTRLESLHLEAHEVELPSNVDYPVMLPHFGNLPSMKTLSVHNASTGKYGYDEQERRKFYPLCLTVAITHLTLSKCSIYSTVLCGFLARCTSLESFEYWPDVFLLESELETFDPAGIVKALQKQCTNTLRNLTILPKTQPAVCMGSLQLFHKLEELTTDLSLLIGKLVIIDHNAFSTASPHSLIGLSPFAHERLLSDTLPPRLVQLSLHCAEQSRHGDPEMKRQERQIGLLLRAKKDNNEFHDLERITIEWVDGSMSLDVATMQATSNSVLGWSFLVLGPGGQWIHPAICDA